MAKNDKVDIKKKPTLNVSGLKAPARSQTSTNQVFTAEWTYPKKAFAESNEARFEGVIVEWAVDYDDSSSKATKGKTERVTGAVKSRRTYKVLKGSDKTKATLSLPRNQYYPCTSGKTQTYIKTYIVVKKQGKTVTKKKKGGEWTLAYTDAPSLTLKELNMRIKKGIIVTMSSLVKGSDSPIGKVFYISKKKAAEQVKITKRNPVLCGVGVRVQGWNSKTPTKKKGKTATQKTVLWNESAPTQAGYFSFSIPQKPSSGGTSVGDGAASHKVTITVNDHNDNDNKGDTGTNAYERYDSTFKAFVTTGLYNSSGTFVNSKRTSLLAENKLQTSMTWTRLPNDDIGGVRNVPSLQPNEYLYYDVEVVNRGIRGNSSNTPSASSPTASVLIATPHNVSISGIVKRGAVYEISFKRTAGNAGRRLTSKYTLQRLYNYRPDQTGYDQPVDDWSDSQWEAAAEKASSWTDVAVLGHSGNKNWDTQTFTDLVTNADPQPFRRTYYRVVASNDIDGIRDVESKPKPVPGFLRIPSAKDEKVDILACSSAENGNAIQAVVVFNKSTYIRYEIEVGAEFPQGENFYTWNDNTGQFVKTSDTTAKANTTYYVNTGYVNSNGTEMSWDTFENAWQSSQLPSTYDFKDQQMEGYVFPVTAEAKAANVALNTEKAVIGWKYTTYYIRGIQPSTKYYIKARRFLKDTETRETDSYGGYSDYTDEAGNAITVETKATPTEVKLTAPTRLVEGKDLSVAWTYDSNDVQKGYQLLAYQNKPDEERGIPAGVSRTLFETGTKEDSAPYAVVPWANVEQCLVGTEGAKEHLFTAVRMFTEEGSWSKESEVQETRIVRAPRASLSQIPPVEQQPLRITIGTDDNQCSAVLRVVAHQQMGWGPLGADNVAEGSIVYSTKLVKPLWTEGELDDGTKWYFRNVDFPDDLALKDLGEYTIEYTAVNDEFDLDSDTVDEDGNVVKQTADFSVKFRERPTVPPFYVVADPVDEDHSGYARISIMDMPGENLGCVVDLYRVTPDGAYLVHEGLSDWRNATLIDKLPPYSRHEPCVYRLAIRSANGVVEWDDRSYAMPGYSVRFDWGDPENEEKGQYAHLTLPYNLKWSDSWTKNSRVELHLDGTYSGYWRGGVDHKNTLSTELVKLTGAEQVARVRALAQFTGPVMVRLPNGCAFAADVQVSNLDVSYDSLTIAASFSAHEIRLPEKFAQGATSAETGLYVPLA